MNKQWSLIATRIAAGLGVQTGELIQIRDHSGRFKVVEAIYLAVELAGGTPLPEFTTPPYMREYLRRARPATLARWDERRQPLMEQYDRVLTFCNLQSITGR
jgi:hypothetical protein